VRRTLCTLAFTISILWISLGFSQRKSGGNDVEYPDPSTLSTAKIIDCFAIQNISSCRIERFNAAEVLAKRGNIRYLIGAYERGDETQRDMLVIALAQIRKPAVLEFMRRIAFENLRNEPDGEPRWYALQSLAEHCDERALARLNRDQNWKDGYPIGCMWWTSTVRQFGKCQYRPAIPHLIEYTNTVACLNISEAAIESLEELYPGKCKDAKTLNATRDCYSRAYRGEKHSVSDTPH
jgi:hypothetical protein